MKEGRKGGNGREKDKGEGKIHTSNQKRPPKLLPHRLLHTHVRGEIDTARRLVEDHDRAAP